MLEKIANSDNLQLEVWLDRVLIARSIAEVFAIETSH
jgi:hypothetical protein